jgi:hypothetical protein
MMPPSALAPMSNVSITPGFAAALCSVFITPTLVSAAVILNATMPSTTSLMVARKLLKPSRIDPGLGSLGISDNLPAAKLKSALGVEEKEEEEGEEEEEEEEEEGKEEEEGEEGKEEEEEEEGKEEEEEEEKEEEEREGE